MLFCVEGIQLNMSRSKRHKGQEGKMSVAFIRKNVVAVVIVLLAFVGGWKYLDMKKDALEKGANARLDSLREREDNIRERELDLAKDRAAFAESLSILRLERAQLAEDRSQLERLKQDLEGKTKLLSQEGRRLEDKERLISRKNRLDTNMRLYAERYASVTPWDVSKACDPGRDSELAGAESLLRVILADANALQDQDVRKFVSAEFFHKFSGKTFCNPGRMR
jgi:hypothetical protein